jgi:chromosome segregation ATPase
MNSLVLAASFLIVTLRGTFRGVEFLEPGTVLDVSRDLRNTMVANRAARDATAEEIAEYRNLHAAADLIGGDLQDLARQRGDLEDEVAELEQGKAQLSTDIEGLADKQKVLVAELEQLTGKRDTLTTEVAALEAKAKTAKAAAK